MSESAKQATAAEVLLETRQGSIVSLVLNRPEKLNALNNDLATALINTFTRLEEDSSVHVVVLSGAGRAFCAGGDLSVIGKGRETGETKHLEPLLRSGMQAVLKIRTMPQPVIAVVHGAAAGAGMNIALAADIRLASEDSTFGQNFARVGLFPDYGGTYFLPQLVGPAKAAEMFYTGEMIDAQTALRLGIVNHVYPAAQLEAATQALAEKIAAGPPFSIRAIKKAVFSAQKQELAHALEMEVRQQIQCYLSEDCKEGIRAFMEKRHPKFQGK
ncbi:MAG TPA: enoyl-CoA hydratase [Candidatus Acidoferrum sp.]|nr:enoyl-CoA hydratase [Candidatus Acidoferrum sp.]